MSTEPNKPALAAAGRHQLRFVAKDGECEICAEKGILPSKAIACALHSTYAIHELERTNAAIRDTVGVGAKLHLALAALDGCVPSEDGVAELESVKEGRARLDRLHKALEHALAIANYEESPKAAAALVLRPSPEPLFATGDFTLHSGMRTTWRINCDALTDADLRTLAAIAAELVGPFGSVEGVPRGGLRLAHALSAYATEGPLLIVDDVFTTGASLEKQRAESGRDAKGLVIFARSQPPAWVEALFSASAASAFTQYRAQWLTRHVDVGHGIVRRDQYDECSCGATFWRGSGPAPSPELRERTPDEVLANGRTDAESQGLAVVPIGEPVAAVLRPFPEPSDVYVALGISQETHTWGYALACCRAIRGVPLHELVKLRDAAVLRPTEDWHHLAVRLLDAADAFALSASYHGEDAARHLRQDVSSEYARLAAVAAAHPANLALDCRALAESLTAALRTEDWRPIESYPRDERYIGAHISEHNVNYVQVCFGDWRHKLTHWMALPPAPGTKER